VAEISERRAPGHGLGAEHPQCDKMQLAFILLFFAVWGIDSASFFVLGYSAVVGFIPLLVRLLLAITSLSFGLLLVRKSHSAVFGESHDQLRLLDTGVYGRICHPMYLGTLLVLLAFFFAIPSLLSLAVWIAFFIFFDKMATYEEKDLAKIVGQDYAAYKKRVPKWLPRLTHSRR